MSDTVCPRYYGSSTDQAWHSGQLSPSTILPSFHSKTTFPSLLAARSGHVTELQPIGSRMANGIGSAVRCHQVRTLQGGSWHFFIHFFLHSRAECEYGQKLKCITDKQYPGLTEPQESLHPCATSASNSLHERGAHLFFKPLIVWFLLQKPT